MVKLSLTGIMILFFLLLASNVHAINALDYFKMGEQAYQEGRYAEALKHYEKASALLKKGGKKDDHAVVLNNIGMVYNSWGQYDKAIEYYRKAMAISEDLGQKVGIMIQLNNIGSVYSSRGQYNKAIECFQKALAINEELGQKDGKAPILNNIGSVYTSWGQYEKAIEYHQKALAINEELGQKDGIAGNMINIGMIYNSCGQYGKAIEHYRKACAIYEELGRKDGIATCLNNIGNVYSSWGQYDKSIEYFQEALVINEGLGRKDRIANCFNNIGYVYRSWGQYDRAIEYYQKALTISEELGQKVGIANYLNNIGDVYHSWGQYDKAIKYYQKALVINERMGQKDDIANRLNNIGMVYNSWGQYDRAIEYYQKALTISEELGQKVGIAICLNNIGSVYSSWGQYDKAIEYHQKALAINEELGQKDDIATCLNNIGVNYYFKKQYDISINYLDKSVALKDVLRLTAKGDSRRDYLSSQIATYQALAAAHYQTGAFVAAFNAVEAASCKYLAEQMRGKIDADMGIPDVETYRKKLSASSTLVRFANVECDNPLVFTADKNGVVATEITKKTFIAAITDRYRTSMERVDSRTRGIVVKGKSAANDKEKKDKPAFDLIIDYYRRLLANPISDAGEESTRKQIAAELYRLLFSGIENNLAGKTDIVIIPDGVLAFVPFESLIMPDGRYMAEKFNIRYTQSLAVSEIIDKRRYAPGRKPIIAFGGAVYDSGRYAVEMITDEGQLKLALLALNRGADVRRTYAGLGYSWTNLPGSLAEVKAIGTIIKDADVYTGAQVSKSQFREMSQRGDLSVYKIIHLATHGLVMPETPELSAVVFSQFKSPKQGDDGYLRAGEILDLNFKVDFVNLSACETGLGKLYSGEGVVGLTQSFMVAGANSLSVSLWKVADESTTVFMIGLYKLIMEKELSYDQALTEMRRQFIKHPKWKAPYFWSPFVYYGALAKRQIVDDPEELGRAQITARNFQGAVDTFTKAISRNSQESLYYRLRGNAYDNLGDRRRAIEDWMKAAQLGDTVIRSYLDSLKVRWQ